MRPPPPSCIAAPPLISVTHPRGIHLPEADLWLDPPFAVEHAFVSHAHSDHVGRHRHIYCTALTEAIMRTRYKIGKKTLFHPLPLREPQPWGEWEMRLLPRRANPVTWQTIGTMPPQEMSF